MALGPGYRDGKERRNGLGLEKLIGLGFAQKWTRSWEAQGRGLVQTWTWFGADLDSV